MRNYGFEFQVENQNADNRNCGTTGETGSGLAERESLTLVSTRVCRVYLLELASHLRRDRGHG
jgi:hypothetical protein